MRYFTLRHTLEVFVNKKLAVFSSSSKTYGCTSNGCVSAFVVQIRYHYLCAIAASTPKYTKYLTSNENVQEHIVFSSESYFITFQNSSSFLLYLIPSHSGLRCTYMQPSLKFFKQSRNQPRNRWILDVFLYRV